MQYNWDIFIPNMPGTPNSRPFTIKAMTTSIPGASIEKVEVPLHGAVNNYAGRPMFPRTLQMTLLETRDIGTRDMMRRWQKIARNLQNNSGAYKDVYSTTIEMVLYDDIPSEVKSIKLVGAWPETLDDSGVDGSQSAAVNISVTFSYDFIDEEN